MKGRKPGAAHLPVRALAVAVIDSHALTVDDRLSITCCQLSASREVSTLVASM